MFVTKGIEMALGVLLKLLKTNECFVAFYGYKAFIPETK